MLELRPNCECCNKDLPPESKEAMICSFECTYCKDCADNVLHGNCPNCGGELLRRPVRPAVGSSGSYTLAQHPASTKRVLKEHGCTSG